MNNFKKIRFSQLMASVRDDLHKYDDEGMIDSSRLIKVVHRCNDVLGINIYDTKQCVTEVEGGRADLPLDFYKMEMVFAVGEVTRHTGLINPQVKKDYVVHHPACMCEDNTTVCVYPVHQPDYIVKYNTFSPLVINNGQSMITGYSPNHRWNNGKYSLDLDEDSLSVNFDKGKLFLSYIADMVDPETGELLIPFHGRLNDYYEYSIKTKILEDLMMNSEADVQNALMYAKRERNLAASEAIDFTMSKSYREWSKYTKKREQDFYNKHYSMFY